MHRHSSGSASQAGAAILHLSARSGPGGRRTSSGWKWLREDGSERGVTVRRSGGAEEQQPERKERRSESCSRTAPHRQSPIPPPPPQPHTPSPRCWSGPTARRTRRRGRRRRRLHQTFITLSFYHSEKQTEAPLHFLLLSPFLSSFPLFLFSSFPFPLHFLSLTVLLILGDPSPRV